MAVDNPISAPLAHRLRPRRLAEVVGQRHLLADDALIGRQLAAGRLDSMIFWGPPGCGKTTLAGLLAEKIGAELHCLSAVTAGVAEVRRLADSGRKNQAAGRKTVLFLDEIHRFNKAQQDFLLAPVEEGSLVLLGATTENPSFSIITPLLSRARVAVLKPLAEADLAELLQRGLAELQRVRAELTVAEEALAALVAWAEGDARRALNMLEAAFDHLPPAAGGHLDRDELVRVIGRRELDYDRDGEEHYNQISAFIKSMRAGDPDAALYWLARMLKAGEEPLYCVRRMIRFASEDIGNAAPQALQLAINARQAYETLGSPEGELALYQTAVYLATAPKSDAVYQAVKKVDRELRRSGNLPVPMEVRNAPTALMKDLGYGQGYVNPHRDPQLRLEGLPEKLRGRKFYEPSAAGYEQTIRQRLAEREQRRRGR